MTRLTLVAAAAALAATLATSADAQTMRVVKCNAARTDCYYADVPVRQETEFDRLNELKAQLQQLQDNLDRRRARFP